jgi:hypothetical protein
MNVLQRGSAASLPKEDSEAPVSQASTWNSLEVVQLVVSSATPVAVAALGIWVARATKHADERALVAARSAANAEWANRRAVERLLELHKDMAPLLNDLMCFFRLIGHFREIDPPVAVAKKRQIDRIFFTNKHLFSSSFEEKYKRFMESCFAQWQSAGHDARIRASAGRLRAERGPNAPWEDDWDQLFEAMPDKRELRREQQKLYDELMMAFSAELGLSREIGAAATV